MSKAKAAKPDSTLSSGPLPDFKSLVESAGDMIYSLDNEGRFTYVNSAALRVLGLCPAAAVGKHFGDFLTPASREVALRHFWQGVSGAVQTPFFEVEAVHDSGVTVHIEVRAGNLVRDGKVVARQGIARDISELKMLQAQIAEKSARMMLLEERTRLAMSLYERMADLVQPAATPANEATRSALWQVQDAALDATARALGLTSTDLNIMSLLGKGLSNREIAEQIHRSPHTVKDHVTKLMRRLGVNRRTNLVVEAIKRGLIDDSQPG